MACYFHFIFTLFISLPHFLQYIFPKLSIRAVFHTGDIVDGVTYSFPYLRAKQHIDDWETYRKLVTDSGMNRTNFWFDVPGNHDYYETKTSDKHTPLPRRYPVRKYAGFQEEVILEHSGKKYRFLFLDINTKPSNPHTFEGLLRGSNFEKFKKTLKNNADYDNTFVVNHYPLYNVISSSPNRLSRKHKYIFPFPFPFLFLFSFLLFLYFHCIL